MSMALSDDPARKLRAALNHDVVDTDKDLPAAYLAACRLWFDALPAGDKATVAVVRATFEKGDETEAERIAATLPAAPVSPVP
jgi:hypothetical protein